MTKEKMNIKECCKSGVAGTGSACGGVYGFAFIGALIYFIQHATSFADGLYGVLKAIVWPAILVYKALELLAM